MAEDIKAGELFIEIKADVSLVKEAISNLKNELAKTKSDVEKPISFQARFENAVAKLKVSELKQLRQKLQLEFDKKLKADVDSASIQRTKQKLASVENQLQGIDSKTSKFGLGFLKGMVGIGAIYNALNVVRQAIDAARSQAVAEAQVAKAVQQTGYAAGYSAKQLYSMASELQRISGIADDEILVGVTNQLLTFTSISGAVFAKAQKAVLDLNAVIAQGNVGSLSSQAIQLGKALENPIAGITALSRAGVTFTDVQKNMIKTLVDQGKLQEAQGIILDEINAKYGGQAKALAEAEGGLKEFATAWGELLEKIGKPFFAVLMKITSGIANFINAFDQQKESFSDLKIKVDQLEKTLPKLLIRYDELKNKANLNAEEQEELKHIIEQVSRAVPTAIASYDKYGRALDINTQKVYNFIEAEKKRLAIINKAEIEEAESERKKLERLKVDKQAELNRITKSGKKPVVTTHSKGVTETEVKVSAEDIRKLQKEVEELQNQIDGYAQQIKHLKGETIETFTKTNSGLKKNTEYADEVLNKYNENLAKVDQINEKLKDTTLTEQQKNLLLKEREQLLNSNKKKLEEINNINKSEASLGYDPKEVAMFEELKFEVEGYYEYRLKLIDDMYKKEVDKAKGNAAAIKEAEYNKKLSIEKLIIEKNNFLEDKAKEREEIEKQTLEQIEKDNKEVQDRVLKQTEEFQKRKKQLLDEYYSHSRLKDEEYFRQRIELAIREAEELKEVTGDPVMAKQFEIERLKSIEEEYLQWRLERFRENTGIFANIFDSGLKGLEASYDTFINTILQQDMTGTERREAMLNAFKQTFIRVLADMLKEFISAQIKQSLVGDINRTAEITKGIATGKALNMAYAPAAISASIMTFGGASLIGTTSYLNAMAIGFAGAMKFSRGGDFIVPQGYPNDSFPMLVESGERVTVTPRGDIGAEIALLQRIESSIQALTKTLYYKDTSPKIYANVDGLTFTEKVIRPNLKRLNDLGVK